MRIADLPAGSAPLQRSVAACLAAILEVDDVPVPEADHPQPWTVWRNWLAQRGVGLVPIADPKQFQWPGPWLAVLRTDVAAVAYGPPPDLVWKPLGGPETFEDVELGYVVAPADVALWAPKPMPEPRRTGTVEAIVIARAAEAETFRVDAATARAGRGLEGDRYFDERGTFSDTHARGHDLTLIEAEVIDDVDLVTAESARRNVVTRGIDLNALVGKRFMVGGVHCAGQRLCEPCAHLQRLTQPGTLRALIHRGGLRADVLTDGEIRVGDPVRAVE